MANTEGMPDSFVESLAMVSGGADNGSGSSSRRLRQPRKISSSRKSWLEERMELPMGPTPAAKVIRASPQRVEERSNKSINIRSINAPSFTSTVSPETEHHLTPMVGDIVERQPQNLKSKSKQSSSISKMSWFAQRHSNGFPSLDTPMGTLVRKSSPVSKSSAPTLGKKIDPQQIQQLSSSCHSDIVSPVGSLRSNRSGDKDLIAASRQDAQAMLSSMSESEIREARAELQNAISPEMADFLKRRRCRPSKPAQDVSNSKQIENSETHSVSAATTNLEMKSDSREIHVGKAKTGSEEQVEKARVTRLISSVQTHEDMDAVYHAEMQQAHPLENDTSTSSDGSSRTECHFPDQSEVESFNVACDLLRSTSPRQALWASRMVSLRLQKLVEEGHQSMQNARVSLPAVLSVSIRCLLDKTVTATYQLHTYALRSLYYLTVIYAHPAHAVMVPTGWGEAKTTSSNYLLQQNFLDDALPTPALDVAYLPLSVRPLSFDESATNTNSNAMNQPAAYASVSSTISASGDGEDFRRDPMWTLLSKMKIIPRLAYLLDNHQGWTAIEAFVASCGILCLVGQRSPGAATAIVDHATLVPCIVEHALTQLQNEDDPNSCEKSGKIPLATVCLFCTLARQSRVAAGKIPFEEILLPILTPTATTEDRFATQQLAIILWRTVLRYGDGLEALASMLTISARHLALPYSNKYSLSTEFLSAYAQVLECVKILWSKSEDDLLEGRISQNVQLILASATKYMASTIRPSLPQALTPSDHFMNNEEDTDEINLVLRFRYNGARLSYLSAWIQLFENTANPSGETMVVQDFFSEEQMEGVVSALEAWAEAGNDFESCWNMFSWCLSPSLGESDASIELESSAAGFLRGFLALLASVSSCSPCVLRERCRRLGTTITHRLINGIHSELSSSTCRQIGDSKCIEDLARRKWTNKCHFSAARLLIHALSNGQVTRPAELTVVRSFIFSLLGRLSRGDESVAAVLFSCDALFKTSGNPLQNTIQTQSSSPVSTLFLGELCGSDRDRKQLDHSFKLYNGYGLTSSGWGSFALNSLLSTFDAPAPPTNLQSEVALEDHNLLPLGHEWLWKTLSGCVRMSSGYVENGSKEAVNVVGAVLQLIAEEEEAEDALSMNGYCALQPVGKKLYYLLNVCLQAEEILSDEIILENAERLLDRYLQLFVESDTDVVDFCKECLYHSSQPGKIGKREQEAFTAEGKVKDQDVLEKFVNTEGLSIDESRISVDESRALETFVEDMTKAYRDYGAQFDFSTRCVRAFLLSTFPSSIRCRVLQELDGMLHLLTLPSEEDDYHAVAKLLHRSVSGGFSSEDGSPPDNSDILNKAASILASHQATRSRSAGTYMTAYCVALIARNSGSSQQDDEFAVENQRLRNLNGGSVETILRAIELAKRDGGTKHALINGVMTAISER